MKKKYLNPKQLSTLVGVSSLVHEDLLLEVEVTAVVEKKKKR